MLEELGIAYGLDASKSRVLMRPQDFKGMRLRTTGRGFDESISGLGAVPVHMNGAETLIKALRSGGLDGMYIGAIYNIPSRNLDKETSFMTISPYDAEYFHLYANLKWWNDLSADLRKVIDDATHVSEQAILDARLKNTRDTIAKLQSDGALSIATTSADDTAALQKVVRPVFDDFYVRGSGPEGRRILDTIPKE